MTKLTDEEVVEIRAALKTHNETAPKRLAAKYGVSKATISLINTGRTRKRAYPNSEKFA